MCKKCENQEHLDWDYVEASITGNMLNINYAAYSCDSSFSIQERINFCPYCGKELTNTLEIEEEEVNVKLLAKLERIETENLYRVSYNKYLLDSVIEVVAINKQDAKHQFSLLGYTLSNNDFKGRVVCTQTQIKKS